MSKMRLQFLGLVFVAFLMGANNADAEFTLTAPVQTVGIGSSESVLLFVESSSDSSLPPADSLTIVLDDSAADPAIPTVNTPPWVGGTGLDVFSGGTSLFSSAGPGIFLPDQLNLSIASPAVPTNGAAIVELFFDTTGLSDGDEFNFGLNPDFTLFAEGDALFNTISQLTFVVNVESIPEPSSAGLMLAMACGCILRRKRI